MEYREPYLQCQAENQKLEKEKEMLQHDYYKEVQELAKENQKLKDEIEEWKKATTFQRKGKI